MKKIILIALLLAISACTTEINSFEDCVAAGNPVMESYPRQCSDGENTFVEEIDVGLEPEPLPSIEQLCLQYEGTWIESAEECEGISQDNCENMGGNFNECASACRNDPDAEICTMQCVLVCEFADIEEEDVHICTDDEKANQICTREYMPVCGNDGKTYGNDCTACAAQIVDSYVEGEC